MIDTDKTFINLLIKDPKTLFCFYGVSSETIAEYDRKLGEGAWNRSLPVLVVYSKEDCIDSIQEKIFIDPFAGNWYINLHEPLMNKELCVELGRIINDNEYSAIAVSNIVIFHKTLNSADENSFCIRSSVPQSTCSEFSHMLENNVSGNYLAPDVCFKEKYYESSLSDQFFTKYLIDLNIDDINSSF